MKNNLQIYFLIIISGLCIFSKKSFAQIPPSSSNFGLNISVSQDRACDSTALIYYYAGLYDSISTLGDTVIFTFYFGDGDSAVYTAIQDSTINFSINNDTISHQYNASGIYTVTAKAVRLEDGLVSYQNNSWTLYIGLDCGRVYGYVYNDCNANCYYFFNEPKIENAKLIHFDENGLRIDSVYTDNTGFYSFNIRVGEIFSIGLDTAFNMNPIYSCTSSGFITDTIINGNHNFDFGFLGPTNSDLIAQIGATQARPGMPMYVKLRTINKSCTVINNVTANFQINSQHVTIDSVYTTQPSILNATEAEWSGLSVGLTQVFWLKLMVDSTAQLGDSICLSFSVQPDMMNPQNNQVEFCASVVNSSDPNSKEVVPLGVGAQGYVAPETNFTYTIHFQNLGNTTASNVSIVDTLDTDLDINSLNVISSSHPYHLILSNGILRINFDNIYLPDSVNDFKESNGSITFQIKAKANLMAGTQITNRAGIKFDFNDYILTNSTLNTIDIPTNTYANKPINQISIFPNPSNGTFELSSEENLRQIFIRDCTGRIVFEKQLRQKNIKFDLGYLKSGLYIVYLLDTKNNVLQSKWIKN